MSITLDNGRRVFALEIGGLSTRYLSSNIDVSSSNLDTNLTTGVSYTNIEGIVGVGAYQASIDPAGGIADYAPVSVSLKVDRLRGTTSDPHVIFGRCGPRSTDVQKAQIATDIQHDFPSVVITVDQDFTSLSYPRVFHIGAETVRVSGATSTTLTITDRGVGRTPIQSHLSGLGGTIVPEVFTEIVNFRGRKASLWMAQRRPDGSISDFTEIVNGFIESSPIIEEGDEITLSLVPLTALIDNTVSETTLQTSLVHGYHNFDEFAGSKLEYATFVRESDSFRIVGSSGSPTISFDTDDLPVDVSDTFDASLSPSTNGNYYIHPRYPELVNSDGRLFPESMSSTGLTYDNNNVANYNTLFASIGSSSTRRVKVRTPRGEIKSFRITSGVQRFPEIINSILDSNTTGLSTGTDGSFVDFSISDNRSLVVRANTNKDTAECVLAFFSSSESKALLEQTFALPPMGIWNDDSNGAYPTSDLERLFFPIDVWTALTRFPVDPIAQNGSSQEIGFQGSYVPIAAPDRKGEARTQGVSGGIALGYYQNGESKILVKDNLGLPTSFTTGIVFDLEVSYYDKRLEQMSTQTFPITHQSTATYSGSDIGYLLHILQPFSSNLRSSFGDFDGFEPAKLYLSSRLRFQRPGVALLKLLQSGGGSKINGNFDLSSIGLNIDQSEIDIDSFIQYESIPNIMINLDLRSEGTDFRSIVTPLLQAMGAVLVMRRSQDGRCKIALQPIGLEQASAGALTINNGDWFSDDPPSWSVYEDIVTQVEINFDYDVVEQKLRTKRVFNNQEAINRYAGETNKIQLDLYGVSSDQIGGTAGDSFSFFLPIVQRIFNLLSNPIRLWRGSIGSGQSALVDAGRYAIVNSPLLKGYTPEYGVENGVGFIRSIRQELMSEGTELEIIHIGTKTASWNDSAKVLAVPSSTTVTIDQDVFSNTDLLGDSVKDSSFFKAGDVVDYVFDGDHDNSTTGLTIQSITDLGSTATITFTAAHGILAPGGTLEPTIYTSAIADQKIDAYIANASGVLGSSDDGKEYG